MRRMRTLGLLLLLALCLPAGIHAQPVPAGQVREGSVQPGCAPDASPWTIQSVDASESLGEIGSHAMALDADGRPHVSYGGNHLYYAWHDGTQWHRELVDPAPGVGKYSSLALDALGRPHISYYDSTNADLKYAYWDGGAWQIQSVDVDDAAS